ncbi:MAG: hypothetical protein ACMUIE_01615 [Thermoplasmatota archaeon]
MSIRTVSVDRMRMLAGMIMLGSIWGLLECTLGGIKLEIMGLPVSMGAVMAGLFGIGFMVLARKMFNTMGVALGVALFAGIMRIFAPVGSCQLCAAIAIMAEGLIFEFFINRKILLRNLSGSGKDYRTLVFMGMIAGFTIYASGYILTQFLTPLVTEGIIISFSDIWGIMDLIIGRAFFATLLGGVGLPLAAAADVLHLDVAGIKKAPYYAVSGIVSTACWTILVLVVTL